MNVIEEIGNQQLAWKPAWSYLPINYNTVIGIVQDITQRTYIKNNLCGQKVRIKFVNFYTEKPLILEQVTIGKKKHNSQEIEQYQNITYHGENRVEIAGGDTFYSDELEWEIGAAEDIVVSVYINERTEIRTACSSWAARSFSSSFQDGNHTKKQGSFEKAATEVFPVLDEDINKSTVAIGFSEIEILTSDSVKTVALFGDSITHMSYYSDAVIENFYKKYPGKITIVNRGIGGNRLLYGSIHVPGITGEGKQFGDAGVERFLRDVYSSVRIDYVVLLEGVNDCTHAFAFEAPEEIPDWEKLAAGADKLIHIAHDQGSQIYIGTVMPFGCLEEPWKREAEGIRQDFNKWIRIQKESDGVIDFDKRVCEPENGELMREEYHNGDGVHPSVLGGRAMAQIIPDEWFGMSTSGEGEGI